MEININRDNIIKICKKNIFNNTKINIQINNDILEISFENNIYNIKVILIYNKHTKKFKFSISGEIKNILKMFNDFNLEIFDVNNEINKIDNNIDHIKIVYYNNHLSEDDIWMCIYLLTKYNYHEIKILSFIEIDNIGCLTKQSDNIFYYIYNHKCSLCNKDTCENTDKIGWIAMDNIIYYIYIDNNNFIKFIDKVQYKKLLESINNI